MGFPWPRSPSTVPWEPNRYLRPLGVRWKTGRRQAAPRHVSSRAELPGAELKEFSWEQGQGVCHYTGPPPHPTPPHPTPKKNEENKRVALVYLKNLCPNRFPSKTMQLVARWSRIGLCWLFKQATVSSLSNKAFCIPTLARKGKAPHWFVW